MPSKYGNSGFYSGKAWRRVSAAYMSSKSYICERCGAPAVICHHKTWLNAENVHDPTISLNPERLEALCLECHNAEHGSRHDVAVFDSAGELVEVKESAQTKQYQRDRAQIDDVVERAKRLLSVVSCESEV